MVTEARRLRHWRRTAAQWTAENPVIPAGEIIVVLPSGTQSLPGIKVGTGANYNDTDGFEIPGAVLTRHDARYAYPAMMSTNGALNEATSTNAGLPRVTMAKPGTKRGKWVWEIPIQWDGIRVRFGYVNETANTGNVHFQFSWTRIDLGEGDVDKALTDIDLAPFAAVGQRDWHYVEPSEIASITTSDGPFASKPFVLCSLQRIDDAGDTLNGDIGLGTVTATRINL